MEKEIVFFNQSAGYLMVDIIDAFAAQYDQMYLVTGALNLRNKRLPKNCHLITVTTYDRSNSIKRIWPWASFFLSAIWLIFTRFRKSEIFLVTNPPLNVFLPLLFLNRFRLLIYDVYPDAFAEMKMISTSSLLFRWWSGVNRKVFPRAERVYTIGDGMKKRISQYISESNIETIPIWTDNTYLTPILKKKNPLAQQWNLSDKFVVLYSGNLGRTHNLEVLLDVASQIQEESVHFVIIGEGEQKNYLQQKARELSLNNLQFHPWQPMDMFPYSMALADLGVVSLGKEASSLSVPSKTFNYLSVGAPLLCLAGKSSELGKLVEKHHVGHCFESSEPQLMLDFIIECIRQPEMIENKHKHALDVSKLYGPENALKFL